MKLITTVTCLALSISYAASTTAMPIKQSELGALSITATKGAMLASKKIKQQDLINLQLQIIQQQKQILRLQERVLQIQMQKVGKNNSLKDFKWIKTTTGHIPKNAITVGYNKQGAIHVCHAFHKDGVHPGQLTKKGCHLSYAGKAFFVQKYQVLTSKAQVKWQPGYALQNYKYQQNNIYSYYSMNSQLGTPIPGGHEESHKLYICRVIYKNVIHIGKTVTGGCDIAYKGKEIRFNIGKPFRVMFTANTPKKIRHTPPPIRPMPETFSSNK